MPASWYEDLAAMAADDAALQRVYHRLRADLDPAARALTRAIHVYPSRRCTYTLEKSRVFVKVRDDETGRLLPECVLRHVLLHELAHTVNAARGHGPGFRAWLRRLRHGTGGAPTCADRVPVDYNPCH